ncbi:hypothetical protein Hjap01_04062 [Haloarcula japonica]
MWNADNNRGTPVSFADSSDTFTHIGFSDPYRGDTDSSVLQALCRIKLYLYGAFQITKQQKPTSGMRPNTGTRCFNQTWLKNSGTGPHAAAVRNTKYETGTLIFSCGREASHRTEPSTVAVSSVNVDSRSVCAVLSGFRGYVLVRMRRPPQTRSDWWGGINTAHQKTTTPKRGPPLQRY